MKKEFDINLLDKDAHKKVTKGIMENGFKKDDRVKLTIFVLDNDSLDTRIRVETFPKNPKIEFTAMLDYETLLKLENLKTRHKTWDKVFNELLDLKSKDK